MCLFTRHTPSSEIYTLSLHDALPISREPVLEMKRLSGQRANQTDGMDARYVAEILLEGAAIHGRPWTDSPSQQDRKSTRLNSSHTVISYAVFCLKKKNTTDAHVRRRL